MEDPFTPGYGEFQGIPKRALPDDTVQYSIYIPTPYSSTTQLRSRLDVVKKAAEGLVGEWGADYIWQREGFQLNIVEADGIQYLSGKTEFGDAIDDEWFIVAILRELSRRFEELWIRVVDTDGEFLLIEAANTLPSWVKPEIMDNRVWINSGQLFLVAQRHAIASISLNEALDVIKGQGQDQVKVQRLRLVEEEAFYRASKYPKAAQEHIHYAIVKVPRKVALILSERPQYISAAVEQFYLRDPISLKACKPMKLFDPKDIVTISIKFTKVLYAQLRSQEFEPPSEAGFRLPPEKINGKGNPDFIATDVGMKVACGFEMLMSPQSVRSKREDEIARDIDHILNYKPPPTDEHISKWPKRSDSDNWLDIDYTEFENNLQGKSGKTSIPGQKPESSGYGDKSAEEKLKKIVERFEQFLNDEDAGAEGVDFDEDKDTDEEMTDADDEDTGVSFDEAEFERMMREMMGLPSDETEAKGATQDVNMNEEEQEIRKVMSQVEAELKEAGVINPVDKPRIKELGDDSGEEDDGDDDEEVNIDFNLAKNLLESFKSQSGMPGPGENLLASMGIVLPRDEGEPKGKGKERETLKS